MTGTVSASEIIGVVVLIVLSAIFSGLETALTRVDSRRLNDTGDNRAHRLTALLLDRERLIAVMLIGNNLVLVGAAALLNRVLSKLIPFQAALITTLILTPLLLIFGEILPKSLFMKNRVALTLFFLPLVEGLVTAFGGIAKHSTVLAKTVVSFLGLKSAEIASNVTREDLQVMFQSIPDSHFDEDEREVLTKILSLSETTARDVMQPRTDVVYAHPEETCEEVMRLMRRTGLSHIPLYDPAISEFIGLVHFSDLLSKGDMEAPARSVHHKCHFVPEQVRLDHLLVELQTKKRPLALVSDEYGEVSGLVSVEDIVEQITGDIHDEHDSKQKHVRKKDDTSYQVKGSMRVCTVNDELNLALDEDEAETIGGLMMAMLQKLPDEGESVQVEGAKLTVSQMQGRRVAWIDIALNGVED